LIKLTAIVTQYDRKKYPRAIETLVALLESIEDLSFRVLVVDNASDETPWQHAFTDRLIHLSGDNSSWEFSAFDRGLEYARANAFDEDLYLFVTDAYMAYGEEFLDLIDREVVEAAVGWDACFGIVDAYPDTVEFQGRTYSDWLRTSFIFVPTNCVPFIEPIATPIATDEIFGGSPESPFAPDAPLSERLKQYILDWLIESESTPQLLEQQWHSKFRLDDATYPFFEAKACAILREQSLAIGLRENLVPVFDFHAMDILRSWGDLRPSKARRPTKELQWSGWRFCEARSSRHFLDHAEFPDVVERCDLFEVKVRGWASIDGGTERVQLEVGGQRGVPRACRDERLDLIPVANEAKLGFAFSERFSSLPLGRNEIRLHFLEAGESVLVGHVRVEPIFEFKTTRIFVPEYADPSGGSVCEMHGTIACDRRVESADLEIQGELNEETSLVYQGRGSRGEHRYRLSAIADLSIPAAVTQLVLRLTFKLEDGGIQTWQKVQEIAIRDCPPYQIAVWHVGNRQANRGGSPLRLEGEVAIRSDKAELLLLLDEREVLVEKIERRESSLAGVASFKLERSAIDVGIGLAHLSLVLREDGQERLLEERTFPVAPDEIQLHVDDIFVERVQQTPRCAYSVRASGWIANEFLVDSLALRVDGHLMTGLGWGSLREEVPDQTGDPLVRHQGFGFVTELLGVTPGDHDVEIVASGVGFPAVSQIRRVTFPDVRSAGFHVVSRDLESLEQRVNASYFGEYAFEGTVYTTCHDVVARLWIDSEVVDEFPISESPDGADFRLRGRPREYGLHKVRVTLSVSNEDRLDTGERELECRRIEIPQSAQPVWQEFFDYFELEGRVAGRPSASEALTQLCFDRTDPARHWLEILEQIAPRFAAGPDANAGPLPIPRVGTVPPLKVLFCSWEAPYSRHGGGVHLMNLLKGLGEKHEITLIHTYGDDLHFAEEARPYVDRMISIPRHNAALDFRERGLLPHRYYQEFIPRLEQVIDQELSTGRYDVLNYEWSIMRMFPFRKIPSVLAVHELEYTAYLSHLREIEEKRALEITEVAELLRLFWFNVVDLPKAFDALVTITPEDARDIRMFSPGSRVYSNEAATEVRKKRTRSIVPFGPKSRASSDPSEPTFLYLANFRHPPNLRAAEFLLKEVMPRVRRQIPRAKLELVGPHAPESITALARAGDHFPGFVNDLEETFDRASFMFLPIFTGTGMRIKAVEALGYGCPIVGTELGLRGIGQPEREAFVIAERAEDFATVAIELAGDPERLNRMRKAALKHASGFLNVERLVRDRERIWWELAGEAAR